VLGPSSNVIRKRTGAPGGGPGSTGFGVGCVQAEINATALTAITTTALVIFLGLLATQSDRSTRGARLGKTLR
jgi:hypothetical protein